MKLIGLRYGLCSILYGLALTVCFAQSKNMADDEKVNQDLKHIPQDCFAFIKDPAKAKTPIVSYDPQAVMKDYLSRHFTPWHNPLGIFTIQALATAQKEKIQKYLQNPGWSFNRRPHSTAFMQAIQHNMHLATFPNCQQKAITLRATDLRVLPCAIPSFTNWVDAGEGYPFDNLQDALLSANEPVYVLHKSTDGAWQFVLTKSYMAGWVKSIDLAYVTPDFIAQWQTGQYITPLADNIPVTASGPTSMARIGQLIPLTKVQSNPEHYTVLIAIADYNGYATTTVGTIQQEQAALMPLVATMNQVARIANVLMGTPYGWGTLYGYRDCSATLQDILMPFGIWLPRDSGPQAKSGTYLSLAGLSNAQKQKRIVQKGIPGLTLIHMPGHIVLYLGEKKGKVYVYNSIWGFHITNAQGKEGRAVLGRKVIIPLDFGAQYTNMTPLLAKASGMILLDHRLTNPRDPIELQK